MARAGPSHPEPGDFTAGPLTVRDLALACDLYQIAMAMGYWREGMTAEATFSCSFGSGLRRQPDLVAHEDSLMGLDSRTALLDTVMSQGRCPGGPEALGRIRDRALRLRSQIPPEVRALRPTETYPVEVSAALQARAREIRARVG